MPIQTEEYMLPCLNKKLFGVECLGCGFQRSLLHLIKGNFAEAFHLYPAIYTLILFLLFVLLNLKFKFKNARKIILTLATINILIIVISYIIKMNS
jgi:hypothetical protein